jgi:hypothetical protein
MVEAQEMRHRLEMSKMRLRERRLAAEESHAVTVRKGL